MNFLYFSTLLWYFKVANQPQYGTITPDEGESDEKFKCLQTEVSFSVHSEPPVEFTKPLQDQTVEEEATATLECEVSRENAEVQWFRDGQEIRKTKKYEMIIDGCKRALLIHDCTLDDSKTYTCDAKDFKTSCFLSVERKYSRRH